MTRREIKTRFLFVSATPGVFHLRFGRLGWGIQFSSGSVFLIRRIRFAVNPITGIAEKRPEQWQNHSILSK